MVKGYKAGAALLVAGLCSPVVAYFVVNHMMAIHVAYNPGAPPDQGAMLKAFFALVASLMIGILLMVIGAGLVLAAFWKSRTLISKSKSGQLP
ncbi:MAG: hypothetical protein U0941_02045 [Planctomycetaceae bacterium]